MEEQPGNKKIEGVNLEKIKELSLEELRKIIMINPYDGQELNTECLYQSNNVLTLLEHFMLGSTLPGQGILDENIPLSVLLGGDLEKTKEARIKYFEKNEILKIARKKDGGIIYIWFKPKNPENPISSYDDIDYTSIHIREIINRQIIKRKFNNEQEARNSLQSIIKDSFVQNLQRLNEEGNAGIERIQKLLRGQQQNKTQ